MNTVWRTLVSASVIAAIGAGCGGGSGGDSPGVTSLQPEAGSTLQKQKLMTTKFGEFGDPRLLTNSRGDILLVWDDRRAEGAINSMFFHLATGWSQIKVVAPPTTAGVIIDALLDNQGNAVVIIGKENILGVLLPEKSFVYMESATEWKPAVGEPTAFGNSNFLVQPTLVADNSETGVAYFVGMSPAPEGTTFYKKLVRVYRLSNTGSWQTLEPAPMPTPDELAHSCDIVCVDYILASADANGRLHVSFDVKDHGKRTAYWSPVSGWSNAFILDLTHQDGLMHETFLNIHPNGIGVAVWQHWTRPETGAWFISGRKSAVFDGTSWASQESLPDGMSKIERVRVDANGVIEVFGKAHPRSQDGAINSERAAGMRRLTSLTPWSGPELLPDGASPLIDAPGLLDWPGGGWIYAYERAYRPEPGQVTSPGTQYRDRIEAWRYSADGWSGLHVLADETSFKPLRFAVFGNQLRVIEGNDFGGDVSTFSFNVP